MKTKRVFTNSYLETSMKSKVLLDTNIIIHRENIRFPSNRSIGLLYNWIDRLGYEKTILQQTIDELNKYSNKDTLDILKAKIEAYTILRTNLSPDSIFLNKIKGIDSESRNDIVDNIMLYNVYSGYVELFITEDRKLIKKAKLLNLKNRVMTIDEFITDNTNRYPKLIEYKVLSVEPKYFCDIDLNDSFFDSLRSDYGEIKFDQWFKRKSNERAYVCYSDDKKMLGFLYLKIEDKDEIYDNIIPPMPPKKRLKVGTFKVESTGFRLGERFLKIIFDYAQLSMVEEIYLTLFDHSIELKALRYLLVEWGFEEYGKIVEKDNNNVEYVLIKKLNEFNNGCEVKKNFPNILYNTKKMFLPIEPQYHTKLFPDSILKTEEPMDFMSKDANLYALQKVYISFSYVRYMNKGDLLLIYRKGEGSNKKYSSVVTSLCVIDDFKFKNNFSNKEEYLDYCKNRTVFSLDELDSFWHKKNFIVLKLIFIKSFNKRVILDFLWKNNIVEPLSGPRPFDIIDDDGYNMVLRESDTTIVYSDR